MIVLSFMAGGIFGFIIMGAIVMASENRDKKRAERYRLALDGIKALNLYHDHENFEDVMLIVNHALADKEPES